MTEYRTVLVTGGAGYVGSHCAAALLDQGFRVVVLDDLSQGHREAVPPGADFVQGTLADPALLVRLLGGQRFDAVFHFAARSLVGESMKDPHLYLHDNVVNALNLVAAMVAGGVGRLVLSSTANLFGVPDRIPIDEDAAIDPGSPYGESKYMIERALLWADRCHGIRSACLRYFNAAGADPAGRFGEDHQPETHLIPRVIDAALGRISHLEIFGDDYPTPDGTCVRDYVHVSDLADAHLRVLDRLETGSCRYNLGNGRGFSVRDVIGTTERLTGRSIPVRIGPRRPGDPPILVASSERIRRELGWTPRFADLETIIGTALAWRRQRPCGYATPPQLGPQLAAAE